MGRHDRTRRRHFSQQRHELAELERHPRPQRHPDLAEPSVAAAGTDDASPLQAADELAPGEWTELYGK